MATLAESAPNASPLNAALVAGVENVSQQQTITFIEYRRIVLPLDGYIFWVNAGASFTAQGSFHIATKLEQREDETIGVNRVVFTSAQELQDFNAVAPGTMYIGSFGEARFAFSQQANFYQQSGLYHYSGEALYPALATQVIDNPAALDLSDVIVSNSLPLWLSLGSATVFGKTAPTFPIYPSFLVPQDAPPPYASIHIGDSDTEAIGSAPSFDYEDSHFQLCKDRVKITLYGLRNADALNFQDFLFQYSLDTDNIGVMNMPVIRDEKRTQREMGILAQKKSFTIDVSYYQENIVAVSRQFLLQSIQTYLPNSL
jgi:hypothetical protein